MLWMKRHNLCCRMILKICKSYHVLFFLCSLLFALSLLLSSSFYVCVSFALTRYQFTARIMNKYYQLHLVSIEMHYFSSLCNQTLAPHALALLRTCTCACTCSLFLCPSICLPPPYSSNTPHHKKTDSFQKDSLSRQTNI